MKIRRSIAVAISVSALVCGQVISSDGPIQKFIPSSSAYARRIVTEKLTLVDDLKKIDPQVLATFYSNVQPEYIANRDEKFNSTDVIMDNRPARRFALAGSGPGLWFILYEHGGIAYHQDLVVFSRKEGWQIAAVVQGNIKGDINFDSLKQAIRDGKFFSQAGPSQF